jgi:hypothetical protein
MNRISRDGKTIRGIKNRIEKIVETHLRFQWKSKTQMANFELKQSRRDTYPIGIRVSNVSLCLCKQWFSRWRNTSFLAGYVLLGV